MNNYFIRISNEQKGPYSIEELKNIKFTLEDYVWKKGMENWKQVKEVPDLVDVLENIPPPISIQSTSVINKNEDLNASIQVKSFKKLYSKAGITIAACFGSVLAGGYLIAYNYKVMGKKEEYKKSILYSVIVFLALIFITSLIPNTYRQIMTSVDIGIAFAMANFYTLSEHEVLKSLKDNKGAFFSNWRAFGIGLLFLAGLFASLFFVALIVTSIN